MTRAGQDRSMAGQVATQFFNQPKAIGVASVAISAFGLIPGFPATLFVGAGALMFFLYRFLTSNPNFSKVFDPPKEEPKAVEEAPAATGPEAVLSLIAVDPIEIEIGYGLAKLADPRVGGDISDRIGSTRRQIATELGFVMPTVRIRDSIQLANTDYVLKIRGEDVGGGQIMVDQFLAVNPGTALESIPGLVTKDPVFQMDALWIEPHQRELAERVGYTVIEPSAVITTHLGEVIKTHAPELISRQDVQVLIEEARKMNAAAVSELIPEVLSVSDVQKVLQHLLRERIPIRDMVTIIETLADFANRTKDSEQLGEIVRSAIARTITRQYLDGENRLACLTFDPQLERVLNEKVQLTSAGNALVLDPTTQQQVVSRLKQEYEHATMQGHQPVMLCGSQLRLPMRRFLDRHLPNLAVLAYSEISAKADVEFVGQIAA